MSKVKIRLLIKRNPKQIHILRGALRRFLYIIKSRNRKEATRILLLFLRDCRIKAQTLRRIYTYRTKVVKAQHYIRGWINIQRARIELLWLAKEKIDKERSENERRERLRSQQNAVKATETYSGFSETMNELKRVKFQFKRLFDKESLFMKHVSNQMIRQDEEKEKLRKEIMEEESKYRRPVTMKNSFISSSVLSSSTYSSSLPMDETHQVSSNNLQSPTTIRPKTILTNKSDRPASKDALTSPQGVRNAVRFGFEQDKWHKSDPEEGQSHMMASGHNIISPCEHNAFLNAKRQTASQSHRYAHHKQYFSHWYEKAMRHTASRKRIEELRKILMAQRRRHLISRQMEEQDMRYKIRRVDLKALKAFLKDPLDLRNDSNTSNNVALSYEDTSEFVLTWKQRVRHVFLLLTKGGLDALQRASFR